MPPKKKEPSNLEVVERMKIKWPRWTFAVCDVCGDYCVSDYCGNGDYHPWCIESPRYKAVEAAKRRAANRAAIAEAPTLV